MSRSASPKPAAERLIAGISLCMIVRDEERFLADALASVRDIVDEICIVDTGSADSSVAIARSFGAVVERRDWRDDFAWARNEALALARHAWILVLDADEQLAPESRDALRALRDVRPAASGRWIRCRNLSDDVLGTGASSNALVRIFPNDPAIRYRGRLHEFVGREGDPHALPAEQTGIEIIHRGYLKDVIAARDKGERNMRMARAAFEADPDEPFNAYNYGMSSLLAGDRVTALAQLERACEMTLRAPRGFRPQALATLAGLYLNDGRADDALAVAESCSKIAPTFPDGHFVRGKALAALGRRHDARDAFGRAIASGAQAGEHFVLDDEIALWKAHNEIAGSLMIEGRYAEAQRWVELGLESRPAVQPLLLNRARCLEAQDDLAGALAGFRSTFDGYRDETSAIEYVNFVFRHGSPDIALAAVESALDRLGEGYQRVFLGSAAAVMLRSRRIDEARALVARALAVNDDLPSGLGTIEALSKQYGLPELRGLIEVRAPELGMREVHP